MAVVFPTKGDKTALLSFMASLELCKPDGCGERADEPTENGSFGFRKEAVGQVESACEAVLENLRFITNFFTGGGPLTGRNVLLGKTAFTSGSVFPHARKGEAGSMPSTVLSDVSAADVFGIANPEDFFAAQQEELELAKTQLESAKEALQEVNKTHGFVLTGDVAVIKKYLGSQGEQSLALLYKVSDARANMKAAQDPAAGNHTTGLREADVVRRLLNLPAESLPSPLVRSAYARFIQTTRTLLQWLTTVLQMVRGEDDVPKSGTYSVPVGKPRIPGGSEGDGGRAATSGTAAESPADTASGREAITGLPETVVQAARTRTVRVRRFEIRDVHNSYDNFHGQARYFFLPEYTRYDARVQRRFLQPEYFNPLRDLLSDLTNEIAHLTAVAERKQVDPVVVPSSLSPYDAFGHHAHQPSRGAAAPGEELPQIVFRPTLSTFRFLRDSLQVYLSTCINEDDTSALLFYEHVFDDALAQARDAARTIQRLPTPPKKTQGPCSGGDGTAPRPQETSAGGGHMQPPPPSGNGFALLQVDHTEDADAVAAADRRLSGWPPTLEERGVLASGFEAYWEVRDRIHELRSSLAKDIKRKNRTHMTRVAAVAVAKEVSFVQLKAEAQQRQFIEHERRASSSFSLWGAMRASLDALGNAVTCKAELNPGGANDKGGVGGQDQGKLDDEGFPMATSSPFHEEKQRLLEQVNRLWSVMEAEGVRLEVTYPGVFFRSEREKWADRVGKLVKKAEGVSVVFSA